MNLIILPIGGLANRMRAIDSAYNLSTSNENLSVWWMKDQGLNCEFTSIFKPIDLIKEKSLSRTLKKLLKLYDMKNSLLLWSLKILEFFHVLLVLDEYSCLDKKKIAKVNQYLFCFIRTWEAFYSKEEFHSELFQLKHEEPFNKELLKIDANTIGVHIRRTDNVWAIENSPLQLFEEKMKKELENNKDVNFYLCSDDDEVKQYFQNDFWRDKVKMPSGFVSRNTEEGVIQAACELFALSKTQKIIGSYWSSFGEIAAKLGNIEIEICTTTPS